MLQNMAAAEISRFLSIIGIYGLGNLKAKVSEMVNRFPCCKANSVRGIVMCGAKREKEPIGANLGTEQFDGSGGQGKDFVRRDVTRGRFGRRALCGVLEVAVAASRKFC